MNLVKDILPDTQFTFKVEEQDADIRLDAFISKQFAAYSRSYFQKLIDDNLVQINGKVKNKAGHALRLNDEIIVKFPEIKAKAIDKFITQDLGVKLIFEHNDFLIIDKPAGLLVHAANSECTEITLVDWLITKFKEIAAVGVSQRAGIVHRLDMNTSGLMVIPRNNYAHGAFGDMFKNRTIRKTYLAVVHGETPQKGTIDYPITRHSSGHKMACIKNDSKFANRFNQKESVTNFVTLGQFNDCALIEAKPLTGRTHQIRVHFATIGHPVIGDSLYGKESKLISRQALHAHKLDFEYEGQPFSFTSELHEDMQKLLTMIKS